MLTSLAHRIVAHPWVYDRFQVIAGATEVRRRLLPFLKHTEGDVVLDVGGGTGNVLALLPPVNGYIWLDNDPMKLEGFKEKQTSSRGILGDATGIPLRNKCVDDVLCIAVLHHLSDAQVAMFLREAARVARKRFILLEPVQRSGSLISRLLWRYDRGSYPRTVEAIFEAIQAQFEIQSSERFAVYHEYLICTGSVQRAGLNLDENRNGSSKRSLV